MVSSLPWQLRETFYSKNFQNILWVEQFSKLLSAGHTECYRKIEELIAWTRLHQIRLTLLNQFGQQSTLPRPSLKIADIICKQPELSGWSLKYSFSHNCWIVISWYSCIAVFPFSETGSLRRQSCKASQALPGEVEHSWKKPAESHSRWIEGHSDLALYFFW